MSVKSVANKQVHHTPHGLSRAPRGGVMVPAVIGGVCAVVVLAVLWLAYTYL